MRNTFGGFLTGFQKQRKLMAEQAKKKIMARNKMGARDVYKLVETSIVTHDGATVHSVELWKQIDVEHTKLSLKVEAETLEKPNLKKLQQAPKPPEPTQPPDPEPSTNEVAKGLLT